VANERCMKVDLGDRSYNIHIGSGIIETTGDIISEFGKGFKIALVTDSNVNLIHGNRMVSIIEKSGFSVVVIEVPAGESSKSMAMLQYIYEQLILNNFTRKDLLIAFGGGVVGDLAGFAASTYMRGIKFIQIPTTLLAQIDSSVGGKVAVNLKVAKNIVGNFYQPLAVISDIDFLQTLKPEFVRDGLAEVVKYSVLRAGWLFDTINKLKKPEDIFNYIEEVVYQCCDIKRGIVERDETESGERMLLNLGHTFGHCVESYFNYERYTHGEGVAIGLYEITRFGENEGLSRKGLANEISEILLRLELPICVLDIAPNDLYKSLSADKKGFGDNISLIIPTDIGNCIIIDRKKKNVIKVINDNVLYPVNINITPSYLKGIVVVPPSKSVAHRAIICAALAEGRSVIENIDFSQDILATLDCVRNIGAEVVIQGNTLIINNNGPIINNGTMKFKCGESGSTLRFMIPIVAALGIKGHFTGEGKLALRPLTEYLRIFEEKGIKCKSEDGLPLEINGRLLGGEYQLKGDISSQFISGLLFALPLVQENSIIKLTTSLESLGYVLLTINALKLAGINVLHEKDQNTGFDIFKIQGKQKYANFNYKIEGDYSQAAFWLVAGAIGNDIWLDGLDEKSQQGDKEILTILKAVGANILRQGNLIKAEKRELKAFSIDVSQIPDLVPALAVLAAFCQGESCLYNGSRLRLKESDRLYTTRMSLNALGAIIKEDGDSLIIVGSDGLDGGHAEAYNDHRIAMALGIAASLCSSNVEIDGANCIKKSYPSFWKDFVSLGGIVNEWNIR